MKEIHEGQVESTSANASAMAVAMASQETAQKTDRRKAWAARARAVLGPSFWLYVTMQVFVVNVDLTIANVLFPAHSWVLVLKLPAFLIFITAAWLVLGNRHFLVTLLYIGFFPFVLLLWKIPHLVLKQRSWNAAVAAVHATTALAQSAKESCVFASIYMLTFGAIWFANSPAALYVALSVAVILAFISLIQRFRAIFRPRSFYLFHVKVFSFVRTTGAKAFRPEDILSTPKERLDGQQLERWTNGLQYAVLFNRLSLFWSRRLRDYQRSGAIYAAQVIFLLFTAASTVLTFAFVHLALSKAEPTAFRIQEPGFFPFLYFSFNNLVFNSVDDVQPVSHVAKGLSMMQSTFSFVLGAIIVSLFLSHRVERDAAELDEAIAGLEAEGQQMEGLVRTEYKLSTIDDALTELGKARASLAKFIFKITESLGKP